MAYRVSARKRVCLRCVNAVCTSRKRTLKWPWPRCSRRTRSPTFRCASYSSNAVNTVNKVCELWRPADVSSIYLFSLEARDFRVLTSVIAAKQQSVAVLRIYSSFEPCFSYLGFCGILRPLAQPIPSQRLFPLEHHASFAPHMAPGLP